MSDFRQRALDYHAKPTPGKIRVELSKPADGVDDLALAYSPGVAEPVREIAEDPDNAYKYTAKGNMVAVISNGTAILGLGNLGPLASKPVMEGKALLFKEFGENRSRTINLGDAPEAQASAWNLQVLLPIIIAFLFAAIIGAVMYKRYSERRRVEILRGILTDSLLALQARNEYIQVIFNCYKDLVRFFRQHGFMKKVYETTREFEWAVRSAFYMVPAEQLDDFLAIFEEARYSDHNIGIAQRDQAMSTLSAITQSISMALGDSMIARTTEHEAALHGNLTKAGEFVDSEGNVQQAGLDDDPNASNFSL